MKKRVNCVLFFFFLIAFLLTLFCWGLYEVRYNSKLEMGRKNYRELEKNVLHGNTWREKEAQYGSRKGDGEKGQNQGMELMNIPDIDFDMLRKKNLDIYAWIDLPECGISYPVLQHLEEPDFYLTHNLDGSAGYPGCIFSEPVNHRDFLDPMTILYGHNMRDGSMFAALHRLDGKDFLREKSYLYIIENNKKIAYRIVGTALTETEHVMSKYENTPKGVHVFLEDYVEAKMLKWLEKQKKDKGLPKQKYCEIKKGKDGKGEKGRDTNDRDDMSRIKSRVGKETQIIILSTCGHRNSHARFLVVAVKTIEWRGM